MASQVLEGTWEDIAEQGAQLAGRLVRLIVLDEEDPGAGAAVHAAVNGPRERRDERVEGARPSIYGKYAGLMPSTDEYLQDKRREIAREDGTRA